MKVELIGDASSLDRAFRKAGLSAKRFGHETSRTRRIAGGALKAIGGGALLAGGLIVKGLTDSIKAAIEQQQVQAQTVATLKSTGSVANVTAKHINQLAAAISFKTGIDDEAIQSSENLLLTFTKIRNEVGKGNNIFDQATVAVQDMSVALKQDAKSSAIQLGKALGDPVRGMTALRRVGVTFTDSQAEMVKKLVATGHMLEAQKIILREVQTEFGGSARAAGKTFGGQLKLLGVQLENIQETIGTALLPVLTKWARSINHWLSQAKNQRKVVHDIRVAARILVGTVKAIIVATRIWIRVTRQLVLPFITITRAALRVGRSFRATWASARKHTVLFYNWLKKMGLKIALAIIEPFSHLPGFLGGGKFRALKEALQGQLADVEGTSASGGKPARTKGGRVASPVTGAIPGAGGRLAVPAPRAPHRGGGHGGRQHQKVEHHHHISIDGKEVAHVVTKHQQRSARHKTVSRSGRHPGAN